MHRQVTCVAIVPDIMMHVRIVTVGSMYSVCTQCKLAVSDQLSTVAKSVHN
jgi:hypothetical protein